MKLRLLCTALLLAGAAAADVPPPPPENPLDPDCAPFTGVWAQSTPWVSRGGSSWMVLAVGSEKASVLSYWNQDDIAINSRSIDAELTCEATANGETLLTFTGLNEVRITLTARLGDEASFTTTREKPYLYPGPPPPDFKGEIETTTWVRIAR